MNRLLTTQIASMTELRQPQKVLERAHGRPVAIMKNSTCVGYFIPVEFLETEKRAVGTMESLVDKMRLAR